MTRDAERATKGECLTQGGKRLTRKGKGVTRWLERFPESSNA